MNNTSFDDGFSVNNTLDDTADSKRTEKVTVVVMLSIFSIVGVIGNAVAFYIFWRRRPTSTSVIFILALAGTDFITCLVTIPFTLVFELVNYFLVYDFVCKSYMFLITSTVPFSAYIMVGIALDRYFCICHPFLFAFTIPRAKAVIFIMGIPAIVFGTITAMSYGTYIFETHLYTTSTNVTTALEAFGAGATGMLSEEDFDKATLAKAGNGKFVTVNNTTNITAQRVKAFYGYCVHNNFTFGADFLEVYKKIHALNFLLAYVAVAVLYILIYKSIFTRRANKARRKKNNLYPTTGNKVKGNNTEETQMTVINGGEHNSPKVMNNQSKNDAKCARKIILTARNDSDAFSKSEAKQASGKHVSAEEIQEDEKTNLLPGGDDAGANTNANGAKPPNCKTSGETRKCTSEYDEPANSVYLGPPPKIISFSPEPKSKATDEANIKKDGIPPVSEDSHALKDSDNKNLSSPDTENADKDTNEDDGNGTTACSDDLKPEEKPLLPQTPPTQSPATPPSSLPLKPNTANFNMCQTDAKNSAANKKLTPVKHVQTDTQNNSVKRKRPSAVRDRNLMANIKTAFMLFIVTLVFIIAFLPALLMANELINFNMIVFYGYFVYNVANPFIYAFMNQAFREDLKKLSGMCKR